MTEDEARAWLEARDVPRETLEALGRFAALLLAEGAQQNLISASTQESVWARHIVDSAQLLTLAEGAGEGPWLDLGSGAGFPGLVIAALSARPMVLVESRRKRVAFLEEAAAVLGVSDRVTVDGRRLELVESFPAAVISARAFAPMERLLPLAHRFSRNGTVWLLPKGRSAQSELAAVRETWQGVFHVEHSVTDPEAAILVARGIKRGRT